VAIKVPTHDAAHVFTHPPDEEIERMNHHALSSNSSEGHDDIGLDVSK
jgi:hypothetical protein